MTSDPPAAGFRLVASDLDGTLLRSDGTVSPRTEEALRRCHARGMTVVLVTGRPPRIVRERLGAWLARAGRTLHELVICSNGAIVWDPVADAMVRHRPLAATVANRIVETVRATLPDLGYSVEMGVDWRRPSDAGEPIAGEVHKLLLHHPTHPLEDLLDRVTRAAEADAEATISGPSWVEVSAAGVTKAAALAELAADLGVPAEQVIAFGDMPNDLPMLTWAGHGVAVANAHRRVLADADEITASNNDDGVAQVLERVVGSGAVLA